MQISIDGEIGARDAARGRAIADGAIEVAAPRD